MATLRYSSSLRQVKAEKTLALARDIAPTLGITRVTDVTRLDRVGLPVYVSIRPDADRRSVCVNAGKGLLPIEAEVGATMEAIELAWAEFARCRKTLEFAQLAVGALGSSEQPFAILDFCPLWGTPIDLDASIVCVRAEDVLTGEPAVVPAETVVHPMPVALPGARYFGTSSNGLASGNSVQEATVHALAEVLERDVLSFHDRVWQPRRVRNDTLPDRIRELDEQLTRRGFALLVRYLPNDFGLPAFSSFIYDREQPALTSPGDGLHPIRDIALIRSVVESAQARLACIHGGRDDLAEIYDRYAHLNDDEKSQLFARDLARMAGGEEPIDYREIPDESERVRDVSSAFDVMVEALHRQGARRILRVVYTPPEYPLKVVRIVVPGLELHSKDSLRIGPRLLRAIRQ